MLTADLAMTGLDPATRMLGVGETFTDGTVSLVEALAADAGARVFTEAVVTRVEHDEGGVRVTLEDGAVFAASTAVIALPLNCLDQVSFDPPLLPALARAAAEHHPGRATKVLAVADGFPSGRSSRVGATRSRAPPACGIPRRAC